MGCSTMRKKTSICKEAFGVLLYKFHINYISITTTVWLILSHKIKKKKKKGAPNKDWYLKSAITPMNFKTVWKSFKH